MTDYSQLSDFEINSAVHNARLIEPYSLVFMGDDRIAWTKENGDQIITDKVPYTKNGVHDYCNNWSDAGPIIAENMISICAYQRANPGMVRESWWEADKFGEHITRDKNPLRAAMIVFLMMQENSK